MVCGELSDALLDQLSALSSEVFLPLLANRSNAEKALPEVVAKSVTDGLQKFVATGEWLQGFRSFGVQQLHSLFLGWPREGRGVQLLSTANCQEGTLINK